jgi:hypothetical protein
MIQKVTSLEHMRGLIQHRYEDDKILGLYTAITLIGFNFIFMVIFAPSDAITLLNLGNYASYFLTMGLNLSVATAFFIVISRVPSHVKRDNELIDAVAGCLYELNVDGSEELLAYKDRTFKYKIFGLLSFVLMALVLVLVPLRMEYEIFTYLNPQDSTLNFVLPGIYSVVCMYPIFIFPLRHDRRFVGFTEALCDKLSQAGYDFKPFKPAVGKKLRYVILGFIPYIALIIVGIGIPYVTAINSDPYAGNEGFAVLIFLSTVFAFPYLTFVMLLAASSLNQHILQQWAYEEYLVSNLEHIYGTNVGMTVMTEPVPFTKEQVRAMKKIPTILRLAEIFMMVMCLLYSIKIMAIGVDYDMGRFGEWDISNFGCIRYIIISSMYGILYVITADAMFSLRSRSLKSYRKIARSCITFSVAVVITALFTDSGSFVNIFDLNPMITVALLYVLFILIVSFDSVKQYYTPYGMVSPPTKDWIRYAFFGDLEFLSAADASAEIDSEVMSIDM